MSLKNYLRGASVISLAVALAACGSSGSSDAISASDVSLRFSDAPVGELENVVITVDQIIFRRDGAEDVVVDTFTSDELDDGMGGDTGIEDADTFTIDLLEVQGNDNRLVLDSVMLPVGEYQDLRLVVLDEDINHSYVKEQGDDTLKDLKVPSDGLKLGAFEVAAQNTQTFVVEFGLQQAMTYNPGPDRYILKPRGVRIVRLEEATSIEGVVDLAELTMNQACVGSTASMAYLYAGHDLDASLLGDVFVREDSDPLEPDMPEQDDNVPENIIAPLVASAITEREGEAGTGDYIFSYLDAGEYTVAISCLAAEQLDDPVLYDGLSIPLPAGELVEVTLADEVQVRCDFPLQQACSVTE